MTTLPDDPSPLKNREKRLKDLIRIIGVVLFFTAMALFLKNEAVRENLFNIERIRQELQNDGTLLGMLQSFLLFIFVAALLVGFGMPRIWVSAAAGAIYGAAQGTALALVASLLGTLITYQLGKSMLKSVVKRRFGKRLKKWRARFRENTFFWVLYARLFPFSNATLTNLLCGASKVRPGPFFLATAIGYIPLTLVFAMFGSGGAKGNLLQIFIGMVLMMIVFVIQIIYSRRRGVYNR